MVRTPTAFLVAALAFAAPSLAQPAAEPVAEPALHLVCSGGGEKHTTQMRPVREWDSKAQQERRRMRPEPVTVRFDADVSVEIADGAGRIRLPQPLISPLNGNHGSPWWDLRDLVVTDGEITGRYRMNALETYGLRIDRTTGRIAISGSPSFHGTCDRYDPAQRRF